MLRGTIEVVEFDARRADPGAGARGPVLQERSVAYDWLSQLRLNHRTGTSAAVALAVIALHALTLVPVLEHAGAAAAPPPEFGTSGAIQASLIDDRPASAITFPSISGPVLRQIPVNIPEDLSQLNATSDLGALYGRYIGQMDARIERAWQRPRSAIGTAMFQCEVEVWQHRDGTVQTVTLRRCNGTTAWQQSLVRGIHAASPLPAPPDPSLFVHRLILHFEAVAYHGGQPADAYASGPSSASAADGAAPSLKVRCAMREIAKPNGLAALEPASSAPAASHTATRECAITDARESTNH